MITVRSAFLDDMPALLALEHVCFGKNSLKKKHFMWAIMSCYFMVAVEDPRPWWKRWIGRDQDEVVLVGYVMAQLEVPQIKMIRLANCVSDTPIDDILVENVKEKMRSMQFSSISFVVRETNIDAQKFLKTQGFRATEVLAGHYEDTGEDGFFMVYEGHIRTKSLQ